MAYEKTWASVSPQLFTADGDAYGNLRVANALGFYFGQNVILKASGVPDLLAQIKSIVPATGSILVGIQNSTQFLNIAAYTVALSATIQAPSQNVVTIPLTTIERTTFEEMPINARRMIPVTSDGQLITSDNPFPITIVGTGGQVSVLFNSISSVPYNITTTLFTYTVPVATQFELISIQVTGDNYGQYDVLLNNVLTARRRSSASGGLNESFSFQGANSHGLILSAGTTLSITVLNNNSSAVGAFEAQVNGTVSSA